jgi:hypothetical protein
MNAFLAELGKRFAERWMALLVVPGVLYTALVMAASRLGQRHALDLRRLADSVSGWANAYDHRPVPAALLAAAVLLAALAVGLAARGVGMLVEAVWSAAGPSWLADPLVRRRRARWERADQALARAADRDVAALAAARNAIALTRPARPTWIGDRLRGAGVRVRNQYGLDLEFGWPRLWGLLPEPCRADLLAARAALTQAASQTGWGALYVGLGARWWPAALAGLATAAVGWRRGRVAAATLADLTESAVDLHVRDLAQALGVGLPADRVTPAIGRRLSEEFRKGT